jgi:hypothetical protein
LQKIIFVVFATFFWLRLQFSLSRSETAFRISSQRASGTNTPSQLGVNGCPVISGVTARSLLITL